VSGKQKLLDQKYRWISKKGSRIQGQADKKKKRTDPTLIDWKEHYSKVQSELIARTATLERQENNEKCKERLAFVP
jgi:hypothetical protein